MAVRYEYELYFFMAQVRLCTAVRQRVSLGSDMHIAHLIASATTCCCAWQHGTVQAISTAYSADCSGWAAFRSFLLLTAGRHL